MNTFASVLLGVTLFFMLGCSRIHTVVVLMPDPDGHVGTAEVLTQGGTQRLEMSHAMTTVTRSSCAPAPVSLASAQFIAATFGAALAGEPPPAEKFILYFHTSTTELVSESRATLATLLAVIKERGPGTIRISGHADSSGSAQMNECLARDRAVAIKELLLQQGIAGDRLTVSSHGKGYPLVPTADGVSDPRNRRVEVTVR
jgi:outer membrane protein OmpA-like peptidoglycan-associated protein